MAIGIVDIGLGNLGSLRNAVYGQGCDTVCVSKSDDLQDVTHLLMPGVGAFAAAIHGLKQSGLFDAIKSFAAAGNPIMGICLGMQLLADRGTEGGDVQGLGLIPGRIRQVDSRGLRLPHVGWNNVQIRQKHPLLTGIRDGVDFYFVHSYRYEADKMGDVLAVTEYGEEFPSIVAKGNIVGAQFHPEKSQVNGLRLLENFCYWDGKC